MEKIKCEVIRDLMPLVADDVASAESKELVNEHIEGCEVCRAYYAGMTAQLARMAMPEDGLTSTFVDFSRQMEKRVRMKKVITALVAAIVALCVVVVGVFWIGAAMNEWAYMSPENAQAWLYRETDGDVAILVKMKDGYGWYSWLSVNKRDSVLWITPHEPALKLWNQGRPGFNDESPMFDGELYWEDGILYYGVQEWHAIYDEKYEHFREESQIRIIPMELVRWGHENDYTTIYEEGDVIPTYAELMAKLEAEGIAKQADLKPVAMETVAPSEVPGEVSDPAATAKPSDAAEGNVKH